MVAGNPLQRRQAWRHTANAEALTRPGYQRCYLRGRLQHPRSILTSHNPSLRWSLVC